MVPYAGAGLVAHARARRRHRHAVAGAHCSAPEQACRTAGCRSGRPSGTGFPYGRAARAPACREVSSAWCFRGFGVVVCDVVVVGTEVV